MPPVDQLAVGKERPELVEGVIDAVDDDEPVGIVQPAHRRCEMESRVVRIQVRPRSLDSGLGVSQEGVIAGHEDRLACLTYV